MKKLEVFVKKILFVSISFVVGLFLFKVIGDKFFPDHSGESMVKSATYFLLPYLVATYYAFRGLFTADNYSRIDQDMSLDVTSALANENESLSKSNKYKDKSKENIKNNKGENIEQVNNDASSIDSSQLPHIEMIERQYEKGIFTYKEKEDLIKKVFNEKQDEEIEKIKENYDRVLDSYRDMYLERYSLEYVELEDLLTQGIIDDKTLNSKLNILEINIAKQIQKEISFKSIKGFDVYYGLEVKNENAVGAIVEIINCQEIRVQLNWDNSLSQIWPIKNLSPTGKVKIDLKDWGLSDNNFLLQSELAYLSLNELKIGDVFKEGEVFFISNVEMKIFKTFDKSLSFKPMGFEQNTFIKCNYSTIKSYEDNFWKIPDEATVKQCLNYLDNEMKFIPLSPELIWTSDKPDYSTTKCVQVFNNVKDVNTLMSSDRKDQFAMLVHSIRL
mgnify:CR=1 FL=1